VTEAIREDQRNQDLNAISAAIDDKYGLSVEILWSAFEHIKCYPTCSIAEAIQYGFDEWVK
jgi:hypothetical protein